MISVPNSGRRCKVCGAKLSSYNRDILCYPCQENEEACRPTKYELDESTGFFKFVRWKICEGR